MKEITQITKITKLMRDRARVLHFFRIFWIAAIAFLMPRFALGSLDQAVTEIQRHVEQISQAAQGLGSNNPANTSTDEVTRQNNDKNKANELVGQMRQAAQYISGMNQIATNRVNNQTQQALEGRASQADLRAACAPLYQTSSDAQQIRSTPLTRLTTNIETVHNGLESERGREVLRPKLADARNSIGGQTALESQIGTLATQNRGFCDGLAAGGNFNSLGNEGEGSRGSRGNNNGGNSNMQTAQMAMQGMGMLSGLMNQNKSGNSSGSSGANSGSLGDPSSLSGGGLNNFNAQDRNGDGIPDAQQTTIALGRAGTGGTVGITPSTFNASSSPLNDISPSTVSIGGGSGVSGDTSRLTDSLTPFGSSVSTASGGIGASAAPGGGGIGSGKSEGDSSGASKMAGVETEKKSDSEIEHSKGGSGGSAGASMLGLGGEGSGLADFMGSLKSPFDKGAGDAAAKNSADFGGGAGALADGKNAAAGKRLPASASAATDPSWSKESLFTRVTDRLALACERAELHCVRIRRSQGEI